MSALEQELMERISRLDEENQRKVLEFVQSIEDMPHEQSYSIYELMKLPVEERERLVIESLKRSANEDFEIFEAYSEDDFDDSY